MKKLLFTLTLALVALAGCKKETQEPEPIAVKVSQIKLVGMPTTDFNVGRSVTISAVITPDDATDKSVTFTSSNPEVATVEYTKSENNYSLALLKAVGPGKATITATANDGSGVKAEAEVDVLPATKMVSDISITMSKSEVKVGYMVRATATVSPEDAENREVTWSSRNTAIARVRAVDGKNNAVDVIGVRPGRSMITATANDGSGVKASVEVTVIDAGAVTGVDLDKEMVEIYVGDTETVKAQVKPADATNKNVTWTIGNPEIATVNDGVVTGVAEGETTLTVTTVDGGFTASIPVKVIDRSGVKIKSSVYGSFTAYVKWSESQSSPSYDLIEGLDPVTISLPTSGEFYGYYEVSGKMSSLGESTAEVKIKGDITNFICTVENLTAIDVSNAPNLIELQVQNNELKSLDVSKNVKLEELTCYNNQLTSLDVSKNVNLETLLCDDNQLTSLDVSKNVKLETLLCGDQLTSLDTRKNVNLTHLGCSDNQLTSLLVSNEVVDGFSLYVYRNNLNEAAITALINSMPTPTNSKCDFYLKHSSDEGNVVTKTHITTAKKKGYKVFIHDGSDWKEQ